MSNGTRRRRPHLLVLALAGVFLVISAWPAEAEHREDTLAWKHGPQVDPEPGRSAGHSGTAITGIEPDSALRGEQVTIVGEGFGARNVEVAVGGVPADVVGATGTEVTFTVPSNAPFGIRSVTATNPGGRVATTALRVLFDGGASVEPDPTVRSSATIGPAGGTVQAGGFRLDVPAGALAEEVEITLTRLASLADSPLDRGFMGGVHLAPEGLRFYKLATLTMTLPASLPAGQLVTFSAGGEGDELHLTPHSMVGDAVQVPLWHFSSSGAATVDPTELDAVLHYEPTAAHQRAEQLIAAADAAFQLAELNGDPSAEADWIAARVDAFEVWYQQGVRPGWQSVGDSMEFFELAAGEWAAWLALMVERDVDGHPELQDEITQAATLALDVGAELARLVLSRCDGSDLADELDDTLRYVNVLFSVPSIPIETQTEDGTAGSRSLPDKERFVSACVHVEIEELSHPPVLADAFENPLTVRAAAVFWNGGANTDVELLFRRLENVDETSVVVDSDVLSGGVWETVVEPSRVGVLPIHVQVRIASGASDSLLEAEDLRADTGVLVAVRKRIELSAKRAQDAEFQFSFPRIDPGETVEFRVRLAGPDVEFRPLTYSLTATGGSLSASSGITNGLGQALFDYTAPTDGGGEAIITAAFDDDGTPRSDSFTLSVLDPVVVSVSPSQVSLAPGESQQFTAAVDGPAATGGVTWSATGGTITADGLYTAGPNAGDFAVTATSVDDPDASAAAVVQISEGNTLVGHYVGTATEIDYGECGTQRDGSCTVHEARIAVEETQDGFEVEYYHGGSGNPVVYMVALNGSTLSGIRTAGGVNPGGDAVEFTATWSGDSLAGIAYWQSDCPGGCYYDFKVSRSP